MCDQTENKQEHHCSEDHECPDRDKCFEMLQSYLDGELSIDELTLKAKLQKCMPCYNHFQLEDCIKQSLKSKVEQRCMPDDLAKKIREQLKQTA